MFLRRLAVRLAGRLNTDAVLLFESSLGELLDWAEAVMEEDRCRTS